MTEGSPPNKPRDQKGQESNAQSRPPVSTKPSATIKKNAPDPKPGKTALSKALHEGAHILSLDETVKGLIPDEADALRRHDRLKKLVWMQSTAIGVLTFLLIASLPILRPYYKYVTITPENVRNELNALDKPNMTDQALLSWATSSITEILTLGFGDFEKQVLAQHYRFTDDGWRSFIVAMGEGKLLDAFKSRQLVLTTVPTDSPVIVSRGPNPEYDDEYQWVVEMPIIMTFVTNNNVRRQTKSVVRLTITRIPSAKSIRGIAISRWQTV